MVREWNYFGEKLKEYVGENAGDEELTLLEDFDDTVKSVGDAETWRKKYEENDADWRRKYRERFFSGPPQGEPEKNREETAEVKKTYGDLFKEE